MAELPIELWHLIFDRLELVELSSCAQVSKTFYVAVKSYRIREIAFTRQVHEWFHYTTSTIDHKHRLGYSLASILRRSSFDFDHLKRLKIGRRSAIDLDVINRFVHLEELDLDLANYKNEKSWTLSLANLKVLYLFIREGFSYVELDTPRLAKLRTFSLKMLEFVYPESVQCIHTFDHSGKLSMFRNLEYLTFTDRYNQLNYHLFYALRSFNQFNLTNLKKLKEIDFYYTYTKYRKNNMNNFKRMTAKLLALDRPNLKVFWYDVQVTDPNLLTEYEHTMETVGSDVAFQLQHYEMLKEKVDFFWCYDFNGSMRLLPEAGFNPRSEEFTSKFLSRYSFGRISVTGQVEERELLLKLIARLPNLFALKFENSGLDQSFFDRMADIIQLNAIPLQQLSFKGTSNESLDFVSKLRDLEWFATDQELSSGLMAKLLRLPSLVEIECSSGETSKRIERLSTNRFRLDGETLSLQGLLERFETKPEIQRSESESESESDFDWDSDSDSDYEAPKCRLM